jgi:hypothetical protein
MKTINDMALEVAEVTLQLMEDTVDWVITDHPTSGDEWNAIHSEVMFRAIEKMWFESSLVTNKLN